MISGFAKFYAFVLGLALLMTCPALAQTLSGPASADSTDASAMTVQPEKPARLPDSPSAHRFWDRENVWLFSGIATTRALDYTSTLNMQARGREEMLLPDDVVNNRAGFAALEVAGTVTSVGLSYLLHRTGHHRMERWLSIGHISVTGFGAARNYALKSKHP
jgi:hypothetical protein